MPNPGGNMNKLMALTLAGIIVSYGVLANGPTLGMRDKQKHPEYNEYPEKQEQDPKQNQKEDQIKQKAEEKSGDIKIQGKTENGRDS